MNTNNPKKFSASLQLKLQKFKDKSPTFQVKVNQQAVPGTVDQNTVSFDFLLDLGVNSISVELFNKHEFDTLVQDEKIVEDLAVVVDCFCVDEVDLTHQFKECGVLHTNKGTQEKVYGYIYCNGRLMFDMTCPPFYFIRNYNLIKDSTN